MANLSKINALMCGTGEYTTGWVGTGASKSDKKIGVVGLTLFDLRRLGKVDQLSMVGVNGGKFPAIRQHLAENIGGVYKDMDLSFEEYPEGGKVDPEAYKLAIEKLAPGSAVIIFTPDPTHYPIALYAIERGMHVLITKPATQLLSHHVELIEAAKKHNVVCFVEHHKRFDPAYSDAKARAQALGEFNFFSAWMSQPKLQLEVFKSWAGKDSDISYYLSSHHIDICCWILQDRAVPTRVVASAATGIATGEPYNCVPQTEDTITLMVDWESTTSDRHRGTAVYTASWTAPLKAGVHSAQHWYYMGEKGDITVDQAHRGYDVTVDETGKMWYNPFYMKYSPSETGHFDGQRGYGYISIEKFIDAARSVNAGSATPADFDAHGLPTIANTVLTTAILNAGRISLDEKRAVFIKRALSENGAEQWVLE
ncbi:GFO-IDH-MocA domain-containing protein [Mycena indigotica]|uniref:GFO-IDH-MocA domain-containing protein n=1 Tax=Mycena indigotica TaxID=2126181 RepID=A0A8H6WBT4_9AGAR|nr:GFO-IDH-MocA domain-containing protein [Mycena indigotica]KAF7306669.1 GFO-IDH-MocA domain-containing protein [Mycena indigotica]